MLTHNTVGDREPKSGSDAARFRSVERIEDVREMLRRNTSAAIPHFYDKRFAFSPRSDGDLPGTARPAHRLLRVGEQVQEDLLELERVCPGRRQA